MHTARFLLLLVLSTSVMMIDGVVAQNQSSSDSETASYTVIFEPGDRNAPPEISITARFPANTRRISYPGPNVGIDPPEWNQRWVRNFRVFASNAPVEIKADTLGFWTVDSGVDTHLTVQYSINPGFTLSSWPAGNEHAGYWESGGLFLVGEALFATSDAATQSEVTLDLPDTWKSSTPWSRVPSSRHSFQVDSNESLTDNVLVVGRFASVSNVSDGFRYEIALLGRAAQVAELTEEVASSILDEYITLFGGAPEGAYLQAMFVSDAEDGEAYRSSSGFRTSLVPNSENVLLWGNQLAHELFHRWMASDAAIAPASYDDSQWLSEGLAEYYANLSLLRNEIITTEQWLKKLEKHTGLYLYYRASPAFDASLKKAGTNKWRERLAVYNGGWTAAFCLDVQTRVRSGGKIGLNRFMSGLWDEFGKTGKRYAFSDLPRVYAESTNLNADLYFENYVTGTDTLPVEECISNAGFSAGIKGYAAEIWAWQIPENNRSDIQSAVWNGLIR